MTNGHLKLHPNFHHLDGHDQHAGIEAELPRTAVASTIEPLICMAEQGVGIAYLPDFAIRRQLREGLLVTVLDDYTDRSGPLRVLWASSRHLAPKLRVFVDFLAANLVPAVEDESDRAEDSGISSYR
jgi:DNA-binding transcriptional LysR family regulator